MPSNPAPSALVCFSSLPTRRRVGRLADHLKPGGLLFAGHSENFTDCREQFELRGKTVYQRLQAPLRRAA